MSWIPSRDAHGGIAEILATGKFPTTFCGGEEYLEGPDLHVNGYMDKKKKLAALNIEEAGDRIGGARMESPKGKTLTFTDMASPQSED